MITEDIKTQIMLQDRGYYVLNKMFKSRILNKRSKLKLYKTILKPIVVHGYEVLTQLKVIKEYKIYGNIKEILTLIMFFGE